MKYLSLFSGVGGFELGIKQAYENKRLDKQVGQTDPISRGCEKINSSGVGDTQVMRNSNGLEHSTQATCVGYSEIDKYATQIYQKHFNHKEYGDITKIDTSTLPDFDLLVGGFPCQAFSIAGKRMGFDDTRGTLFFEIARILRDKKPKLLLLENVKGLLSHDNQRTFETILCTLSELGYSIEWQVLNSKNFGVPQNRERVFIVGHLGGFSGRKVFPIRQGDKNTNEELRIIKIGKGKHQQDCILDTKGLAPTVNAYESHGSGYSHNNPIISRQPLKFLQRNQKNIEGDYAYTVDSMNTGGVKIDSRIRRLTPTECERLQGFPDGWTEGISDTQRYKCLGNAVTVNVIQAIIEQMNLPL